MASVRRASNPSDGFNNFHMEIRKKGHKVFIYQPRFVAWIWATKRSCVNISAKREGRVCLFWDWSATPAPLMGVIHSWIERKGGRAIKPGISKYTAVSRTAFQIWSKLIIPKSSICYHWLSWQWIQHQRVSNARNKAMVLLKSVSHFSNFPRNGICLR